MCDLRKGVPCAVVCWSWLLLAHKNPSHTPLPKFISLCWDLEISHDGRIYTMETSNCYEKLELFPPQQANLQIFASMPLTKGVCGTNIPVVKRTWTRPLFVSWPVFTPARRRHDDTVSLNISINLNLLSYTPHRTCIPPPSVYSYPFQKDPRNHCGMYLLWHWRILPHGDPAQVNRLWI